MDTDNYDVAYWNAHNDPSNPDRWYDLFDEARSLGWAYRNAGNEDEAVRWFDTMRMADFHRQLAVDGISPLSDEGRMRVARRMAQVA
jgi:hypothetical protein